MIDTFENLDTEKKKRILNAAMEEFSAKGYKQTATDDIVARAGIAKGALFHYFGSKEGLFIYLLEFAIDAYWRHIYEMTDLSEPDLFVRLRQVTQAKLEVSISYPAMSNFLMKAIGDTSEVAVSHLEKRTAELRLMRQDFYANVDFSRFKEGLDIPRTIKVITWVFEGFSSDVAERAKASQQPLEWEKEFAEAEEYLCFFQNLLYKVAMR